MFISFRAICMLIINIEHKSNHESHFEVIFHEGRNQKIVFQYVVLEYVW
jgi:hypothetical protein